MSDIEDEMDDVQPSKPNVQFGADKTDKGKRIASDLPVEAEDNLPWCVGNFLSSWKEPNLIPVLGLKSIDPIPSTTFRVIVILSVP